MPSSTRANPAPDCVRSTIQLPQHMRSVSYERILRYLKETPANGAAVGRMLGYTNANNTAAYRCLRVLRDQFFVREELRPAPGVCAEKLYTITEKGERALDNKLRPDELHPGDLLPPMKTATAGSGFINQLLG